MTNITSISTVIAGVFAASITSADVALNAALPLEQQIYQTISTFPNSDLSPIYKHSAVQSGRCAVWVTETFQPGAPVVSQGNIIFPYTVDRPDHKYNCVDRIKDSSFTVETGQANISSKVTARYRVRNGKINIFNILDHGLTEETYAGEAILRRMRPFQ